ncbi:MAG: hypothetical protein ACREOU_06920 [Candidatus Eiseniibacteriota bacterium]
MGPHVRLVREERRDGQLWSWYEAALWQSPARPDQSFSSWRVVRADTALSAYGSCEGAPPLPEGKERPSDPSLSSLLDSMRIGSRPYRILENLDPGDNEEHRVWIASQADTNRGVETLEAFGDTDHAMEPVIYVDRKRGVRREVYPVGTAESDSVVLSGQLALGEAGDYLLIGAEYSGASSRVVDMKTGKVRFILPKGSSGAVWVPAPSPAE